jgi:hypothetical protein
MASHATTSKLPNHSTLDDNLPAIGSNFAGDDEDEVQVITNPNAEVDDLTIRQWSEVLFRTLINTPVGPPNGLNDPKGTVAAAINNPHSDMFFITGVPPSDTAARTFVVHHGQDVLQAVVVITDAEGPGGLSGADIGGPGQTSFADEVKQVLADVKFSDVMVTVDGKAVGNLHQTNTGIFSAGVVQPGTEAVKFFSVDPGTSLATTGQVGYFAVYKDLSEGTHKIISTSTTTFNGQSVTATHTDIIKVV